MSAIGPSRHVFALIAEAKTWMSGTRPGMTEEALVRFPTI
jgi:hypothetical protein